MRGRSRQGNERGATLVEFAVIFPLIIMLVMGIAEFSLAFKDWLTISHASRAGARAGATAAHDIAADIQVLEAIEQALTGSDLQSIVNVRVSLTPQWFTGLFASTSTWTADTIMRLEPRVFS